MLYKCKDCGNIFEDGEQRIMEDKSTGFYSESCAVCDGDFAEADYCDDCGKVVTKDELYDGLCVDCLRETATYEVALTFLSETGHFLDFMVCKYFECDAVPKNPSEKFTATMLELYLRMKADDILRGKTTFLDCVREYIFDDDSVWGIDTYAEWRKKKRGVKLWQ